MTTPAEMLEAVTAHVLDERRRRGDVKVDLRIKPEPSGEAYGEFALLLDIQLMTTVVGHGGWQELAHVPTLEGVYREVLSRSTNLTMGDPV